MRVFPSGKMSYCADYRTHEGRRRRTTIGPHGRITTDEARKLALVALSRCRCFGPDHGQEAAAQEGIYPIDRRGRIERHIIPLLGTRMVRDLASTDVQRFIRDVASGKTAATLKTENKRGKAIVAGGAGTAARTAGLLGGILSFAVSEGVIPINPARGVERPAGNRRTARLTPEQYGSVGTALQAAEDEGEAWQGITAVRLLALTGCRLSEIVELKWSEADRTGGCFRLEDTKEGASVRPVGRAALDVLDGLKRVKGCSYVLPPIRSGNVYGGLPRALARIMARAKLDGVTAHTLRHSYGSTAGDLGYSALTIGALIGHAAGSVTSRYVHHLDPVLRAAADKVADAICQHMTSVDLKVCSC